MLFPLPHTFRFLTSVRSLFLLLVSGCLLLPILNQTAAADEIVKPVILLTGFEPFGPQRPPIRRGKGFETSTRPTGMIFD